MSRQKNKKKVWIWVCVLLAACLLLMFFNRPRIPSEGIKSVILYPVPSGQLVLTDEEEIRERVRDTMRRLDEPERGGTS